MEQPDSKDQLQSKTGRGFAWIAVIAVMFGLTAFYQALSQRDGGIVSSIENGSHALVVLQRERSGHYVAEGQINGNVVMFLVDTGATDVAVSEKMARTMGLEFGPRIRVMTAAGPVNAWVTRLDQVRLGSLELNDVRATITPGLNDTALLGMSFLKHFSLRQDGDQLRIEQTGQDGEGAG
jgi:aspartyl protease family protein